MWFPPIYKFMHRKYVRDFLKHGRMRIGTSKEFRVPDGKDGGRADPQELVSNWLPKAGPMKMPHDHPFFKFIGMPIAPERKITFNFEEGVRFVFSPNAYVFSTSGEYTEELAARMASEFHADTCICIADPEAFGRIIAKLPVFKGASAYMNYVEYGGSNEFSDFQFVNPFRKPDQFAWQKEFRLIIDCQENDEPFIAEVPEITPLLSRVR